MAGQPVFKRSQYACRRTYGLMAVESDASGVVLSGGPL